MSEKLSRRKFVIGGATIMAAGASTGQSEQSKRIAVRGLKPVVISAANGNHFKNGGKVTCVEKAFAMITDGADVLDAVIAGVNILELDPEETSVGYGGLPNADGVVQLDSSVMHGPKKRAGAVAALEGVRTPSLVAKAVMEDTDHHLLVGPGCRPLPVTWASRSSPTSTPRSCAGFGWNGSGALTRQLSRPQDPVRRGTRSHLEDGRGGLDRRPSRERHHQLQRPQLQGRTLRRNDDQRPGVQDSGPCRRFTHPGAGLYVDGSIGAAGSTGAARRIFMVSARS